MEYSYEDILVERIVNALWRCSGLSLTQVATLMVTFTHKATVYNLLEELVEQGILVKKFELYYLG